MGKCQAGHLARVTLFLAGLLLVFWAPLFAQSAPAGEASPLDVGTYTITYLGQNASSFTDQNRATKQAILADETLVFTAEQPFTQLYLIWDTPPATYALQLPSDTALTCGENGVLHDYISLPEPTDALSLRLSKGEATLCEAYFFTEGSPPAWVQQWQPPLEKADLLVLPTHADDEHLFFGGTLPTYAGERELAVQVAYLTSHWGEPYRPHELLNGLWAVGVRHYPLISPFPDLYADSLDAALGLYDRETVLAWQVETLRRFKPMVVVGHDVDGEYGHGVHQLNADTLMEALELAKDPAAQPESAALYGCWEVSKTYLHLWPLNTLTMDWGQPLDTFGGATALEVAKEGFAQHASQQNYFAVEDFGPYDCRQFGLYQSAVGPDTQKTDFFENIPSTLLTTALPVAASAAGGASASALPKAPAPSLAPIPQESRAASQQTLAPSAAPPAWAAWLAILAVLVALAAAIGFSRRKKHGKK